MGIKSLVIAPQWIGDAVMTEPLLRRLAARGERITVAAVSWVAPVYRAMPQVDEVLVLPFARGGVQWAARRAYAAALRGRFDRAYVCPNSLKSALIPLWAGIPVRTGYSGELRFGLLNRRLPNPAKDSRPPMVAFYSALSGEAGVDHDRPALQVAPEAITAVLVPRGLQPQGFYVVAPGAEYGPAKRWPASHFAAMAERLEKPVLLLGSAKDEAVCREITDAVNALRPGHCVNLAGRTSLDEAVALIAGAHAMVSNDSGLMHVAAAFGVRQVAIFGSSSPLHTPPLNPSASVVWLKHEPTYEPPLDCAPCFQRECPLGHTRCLNDITPDKVLLIL
ncbi:lipopolysaccharide heptosyltransferase II [Rhodoferax sp.]|uniref:lipopolysaccharide heptosyltransferase II n=1 Tax=Rhodoferax sp. TaxID=50421 RepID=UPI0025CC18D3|nr:lipopolysaccharide heptosyltransferase II [Rhodoferax sp.]